MHRPIFIKPATVADAPHLLQLVNGAYRGEGSKAGWTTEADLLDGIRITEKNLLAMLSDPQQTILKATGPGEELVGCVNLQLHPQVVYLGMLTVSPTLQNAGIGKQLLTAAEQWALTNGRQRIRMTVITARDTLIAWYQRHGYAATGELLPFPKDPDFGAPRQPLQFMALEKNLRMPA